MILCVLASEGNREREAAGADPGLPGQRVRCRRPAGGRREQRRGAGACGRPAPTQRRGQPVKAKEKQESV